MIGFLLRRAAWSVLVVWFVVSATFAMVAAVPANPAQTLVGPHATPATIERVRKHYCLDQGFIGQYGCFVGHVMQGDLGTSFRTKKSVASNHRRAVVADRAAGAGRDLPPAAHRGPARGDRGAATKPRLPTTPPTSRR